MNRRTLAAEIATEGIALHSGALARMTLSPAPAGSGVVFRRSDLGIDIPARYDRVTDTRLGTQISLSAAAVGVIEHLMAALSGAEIDDLTVSIEGPEPPILDGDALSYLSLIERAGVREFSAPRRAIRVERAVEVEQDGACARLKPSPRRVFAFEIEFASRAIGRQTYEFDFTPEAFRREIAPARTFGFLHELDALRKMNRGRGASLENTLAIDGDRVVNAGLMRFSNEFVRHKILDAIGDLALAGAPLLARFEGRRSGHALNNALLRKLFADPSNYAEVNLP
ncbi:MAG TPA: UDP-3-O-acyl-N-acetylglucosamine deacetylase [Rhizomicrobium sp.]|jgi:UDP-3-O-[3-hydroxymyristoyl] N-acetylglucosamine deacetylase|nr:UDP-3-O-acyl-N-acetylglucosamine deacetylase [Rhizomicrobium sp.]